MKAKNTQIVCIFLCAALSFFITPQLGAQQDVPSEVIQAAEEGLPYFLDIISKTNDAIENTSPFPPPPDSAVPPLKVLHGFTEDDPLDQAYLGEPFQFHQLNNDSILNYTRGNDVSSALTSIDLWYFPIMLDGDTKSILRVAKKEGSWKTVGIGMAELAVELGKIREQWPLEQGYTPLLAACDEASRYLFTVPQFNSKNLTIITWAKMGVESKDYSKLEDSEEFIEELKARIEQRNES